VRNGAEWTGGVGRFYCRWAEIDPGTGPQDEAENTGDSSENKPKGPIGLILGRRESKESVISRNSVGDSRETGSMHRKRSFCCLSHTLQADGTVDFCSTVHLPRCVSPGVRDWRRAGIVCTGNSIYFDTTL
jgi:hypothetical protein